MRTNIYINLLIIRQYSHTGTISNLCLICFNLKHLDFIYIYFPGIGWEHTLRFCDDRIFFCRSFFCIELKPITAITRVVFFPTGRYSGIGDTVEPHTHGIQFDYRCQVRICDAISHYC